MNVPDKALSMPCQFIESGLINLLKVPRQSTEGTLSILWRYPIISLKVLRQFTEGTPSIHCRYFVKSLQICCPALDGVVDLVPRKRSARRAVQENGLSCENAAGPLQEPRLTDDGTLHVPSALTASSARYLSLLVETNCIVLMSATLDTRQKGSQRGYVKLLDSLSAHG